MTDSEKLLYLAGWFDTVSKNQELVKILNWDTKNTEVQNDLRRIAEKLSRYENIIIQARNCG